MIKYPRITLALIACFSVLPVVSHAGHSSEVIRSWCTAEKSDLMYGPHRASCLGYLTGVRDSIELIVSLTTPTPDSKSFLIPLCMPSEVTTSQLREVWLNWTNEHPASRSKA